MTIEQRAEDIVREMVPVSWNGSIEIVAALLRELELARRVADAALAIYIASRAVYRVYKLDGRQSDADEILATAQHEAATAFDKAVREYRASVEAAAINTERGINDERRD